MIKGLLMILPVTVNYTPKYNFKGKIAKTENLNKALGHFTQSELKEFQQLEKKAAKICDGKIFHVILGAETEENLNSRYYSFNIYHLVQLMDNDHKFYEKEYYKISESEGNEINEIASDTSAFAKAIIKPLKDIYHNVKL